MLIKYNTPKSSSFFEDIIDWQTNMWSQFDQAANTNFGFNSLVEYQENADKVLYFIDLPGTTKENVELIKQGNTIRVKATRSNRNNRSMIDTSFTVSRKAKQDTLNAELENGVLIVSFDRINSMPLKEEAKKIEIKSTSTDKTNS